MGLSERANYRVEPSSHKVGAPNITAPVCELGKKGNKITMQITEAFKGKTLVITGGTGSFASA